MPSDQPCGEEAVWTHDAAPIAGSIVGSGYRIIRPLGSGSMGTVVLARDESIDRFVAIKFTHRHLLGPSFRERVLDEARSMARVNHPNVLQVYAVGEHVEVPYIVMEFVDGCTLSQWLAKRRSPPDVDVALSILGEVCSGVEAIHAQNVVHYDIKPSNILLDDQLRPKVADLGLAVRRRDEPGGPELVGTPAYMAPEVAFSSGSDPALRSRADVYSLACVAYELLTGHPPFDGSGILGLLLQHASEPVPRPSSLRAALPARLDHVLLHALAKDPHARTPSIEALRRGLDGVRRGGVEPARILVAEDDADFREGLKLVLAKEFPDAEIECVADGLTALSAFDRNCPSVSILDLRMPGIDGMSLTRILRERSTAAAMPIIVLTASGGPDEWRQLARLGADRLLLKPVIANDVVTMIRCTLRERSGGALPFVA